MITFHKTWKYIFTHALFSEYSNIEQPYISTHPPPPQNGRHCAGDIFICIVMNGKFCVLIKVLRKFVLKGPIDNNPALVKKMAWRRICDMPLSERMMTSFPDKYMRHSSASMSWRVDHRYQANNYIIYSTILVLNQDARFVNSVCFPPENDGSSFTETLCRCITCLGNI